MKHDPRPWPWPRDLHPHDCDCAICEPDAPSVPRLSQAANAVAAQVLAGAAFATALAFAWDAHAAARALGDACAQLLGLGR